MKDKDGKRFHITIVDNKEKSIVVDTDADSIVGVLQKEDNVVSRFAYADTDTEGVKQLIIGMVREAAHISNNL